MPSVGYSSNTYVPSPDATGGMMVGYSRNKEKFPLNKYMQVIPVKTQVGLYWEWTSREAARIVSSDDREHLWPDGQDAPDGKDELETFQTRPYRTFRRSYPFTIGDLAVQQAEFPILQAQSAVAAQKMMTARTLIAQQALATASWSSIGHLVGVNGGLLPKGQGWNNGTEASPNILNTLMFCASIIHRDTIGGVDPEDLILVVGVDLARQMAAAPEIHKYLSYGPAALGRLTGSDKTAFVRNKYGLPVNYAGFDIVVEDTPRVTTPKSASGTESLSYIMPSTEAYLVSRPGGLEGVAGTKNFSTLQGFFKEESTVEVRNDPDNRRTQGRIITDYDIRVVALASGVRLNDLLSNDSSGV